MVLLGPPLKSGLPIDPGPDPSDLPARYIDNGFWQISEKTAKSLCPNGKLPRHGYETIITYKGYRCYVTRTIITLSNDRKSFTKPRQVWAIRVTNTKS